ncbi:MAG: aconitate hydratase 1 [Bacillus thermozeamaize]|uniref:Aconitate hydratase n=1 Tax=Bacillus thermozeamaize TaxID=230954 RepID=A0A1Y3PTJ8_9BACI|nr:MAG: aconitate hydratase 1 [Bacillus thermozeamaize]
MAKQDRFGARARLQTPGGSAIIYRLNRLAEENIADVSRLPFSIKVLLESLLRQVDGFQITEDDVVALAKWNAANPANREVPFKPARVILQDFTGVPAVVDLAALRDAMARMGGDPKRINPLIPVDLVIDHSVQVDFYGSGRSLVDNMELEFKRNRERYEFLRWAQSAFENFRVVPPATGIVHQVNLEFLAKVVQDRKVDGETVLFPDSLVGTDSHTTMINGLGVLGWGVGGIEAEAGMLGQPLYMLTPQVIGFKLTGELPEGATATDLALTITQMLREKGVVGKFVEFYGTGLSNISLADRATIANMAPEYGATMGFFPVDEETLRYLRETGRSEELVQTVERYTKEQGLFRTDETPDPVFTDTLELDLSTVEPSLAGPKRPQDRVRLSEMKQSFRVALTAPINQRGFSLEEKDLARTSSLKVKEKTATLKHGSVVIAAITSCTNTSNPSVLIGAGLLAKKAVERGLEVAPYVKTSLAPGSRVVSDYLDKAGLTPYLEKLGFYTVGYGCTTCIGNSGPLDPEVEQAIAEGDLVVASVLSGNRNFEGRIHPAVKANYLASPPLVVAYALAGTVDIDLLNEPIGQGKDGQPVYLRDIWPSQKEVQETIASVLTPELFKERYGRVFDGNEAWNAIPVTGGQMYEWNEASTYIQRVPFFDNLTPEPAPLAEIRGARALAVLGDSVTTDHISPAGSIQKDSPAGKYLQSRGVEPRDFNSYGSRRGNHEVMMRGTFANIRIKNQLVPGVEGGYTRYLPTGEQLPIYDAAMKYMADGTPLVVLAGKEYGTGSSRDWAAKGTYLLGVKAVIAESFERIHRSNLVGMGVLPLQFVNGESWQSLGLTGEEQFDILGIDDNLQPQQKLTVKATRPDGSQITFEVLARLDTPVEVEYYRNGGILQTVLRNLANEKSA